MISLKIDKAFRDDFLHEARVLIQKRIKRNRSSFKDRKSKRALNTIEGHLDDIIAGSPGSLRSIARRLLKDRPSVSKNYVKLINKIFNYDQFCSSDKKFFGAYPLLAQLNLRICPYCGENFILSTVGKRKSRGPLDHFIPKDLFPEFATSLHNLIPCCGTCNSLKSNLNTQSTPILHPHEIRMEKDIGFKFNLDELGRDLPKLPAEIEINLKLENNSVSSRTFNKFEKTFQLNDRYVNHRSYVLHLIEKTEYIKNELAPNMFGEVESLKQNLFHVQSSWYLDSPLKKLELDLLSHPYFAHIKKK